jgi:pimeloyl-ACP methyl ester carboxylesterase
MFDGFSTESLPTERGEVFARIGGNGPPLLLLHGYPETQLMWHSVAPLLAERFTIIAADLSDTAARSDPSRPMITRHTRTERWSRAIRIGSPR